MNKRADGGVTLLIVLIVVIAVIYGISYTGRDCNTQEDCRKGEYCSSNFECKEHPIIEREVVKQDLVKPAWIITIGAVLSTGLYAMGNLLKALKKPKRPRVQDNFQQYY